MTRTRYDVSALSREDRDRLRADIRALGTDEMNYGDPTSVVTWEDVEAEHYRRVGGQQVLTSYLRCLSAQMIRASDILHPNDASWIVKPQSDRE